MRNKLDSIETREKNHFDKYAKRYDTNYSYNKSFTKYKILKKVDDFVSSIKSVNKKDKLKILELGCGTGEYTKFVASKLPKSNIVAIDISPQILKIAKRKCSKYRNIKFYTSSAYKTKFKTSQFDVVFGFYVLHHVDVKKVSTEAHRVLKKGGLLYFYEPNILNPVVYLIKSNSLLKKLVGDSPDEFGINPFKVSKSFKSFKKIVVSTSEFIIPITKLGLSVNVFLDKITAIFSNFPLIRYMGGSVKIFLQSK